MAEGFDQLLALVEKTVDIYNDALAGDIERLEELFDEPGAGQRASPLTIDLARLIESVQGAAREQVAYLVDMAKADALDLLGETRQALDLVDRYVFDLPEKAIEFLKNYPWQDSKTAKPLVRFEVSVRYDDGSRIEGQFASTVRAVEFLKNKVRGLL